MKSKKELLERGMPMKEVVGKVFSIAKDNAYIPGCTVSKSIFDGENYIIYFSMAPETDISAEIFPYHKLIILEEGSLEVYGTGGYQRELRAGEAVLTQTDKPIGMRTEEGAIYTEISISMFSSNFLQIVPFPTPDGPDNTKSLPLLSKPSIPCKNSTPNLNLSK